MTVSVPVTTLGFSVQKLCYKYILIVNIRSFVILSSESIWFLECGLVMCFFGDLIYSLFYWCSLLMYMGMFESTSNVLFQMLANDTLLIRENFHLQRKLSFNCWKCSVSCYMQVGCRKPCDHCCWLNIWTGRCMEATSQPSWHDCRLVIERNARDGMFQDNYIK